MFVTAKTFTGLDCIYESNVYISVVTCVCHGQDIYRTWLYIWVTRRVPYKKQQLSSPPIFLWVHVAHFYVFCVGILCVFSLCVPCYDFRSDSRMKTMFGSSLPPVIFRRFMFYLRYLCLLRIMVSNEYCLLLLFCFSSSCVSNVAIFFWIVHCWLPSIFVTIQFAYMYGLEHKIHECIFTN